MPRRSTRPPPPPPREEERSWIFFNVGLHYPGHIQRMSTMALQSAERLQSTWPSFAPVPEGLTADFGPEIFQAAARIAVVPRVTRSGLFRQGVNVSVTDLGDGGFLSDASQQAVKKVSVLSNVTSEIPNWPAAIGAFRSEKFYFIASGAFGRPEIIRELLTVAAIITHSRFNNRGVDEKDLNRFMDGPVARLFQARLFDEFPEFKNETGRVPHVPIYNVALAVQNSHLDIDMLYENHIIINGNGNGRNGHNRKPKEHVTIDLDQISRLTQAKNTITPQRRLRL